MTILGPKTTNKKPAVAPSTSRVQHNNIQTPINVQHQVPNAETSQSTLTTPNDQVHREEPTHHTLPHKPMQTVTKNQHVFSTETTGANTVFQVRTMIIDIQKHAKNVWRLETKQKTGVPKVVHVYFSTPKSVEHPSINKPPRIRKPDLLNSSTIQTRLNMIETGTGQPNPSHYYPP